MKSFKSTQAILGMIVAVLIVAGCSRAATVVNIVDAPVGLASKDYSLEEIQDAIYRAGIKSGWDFRPVEPGHVVGTLKLRIHVAVVNIKFSPKVYSIVYYDSENLGYNGKTIHKNYNGWIQDLKRAISDQLANLK
jgi:NADH/NAD ratio-sensing transcriptional regulator Rex